MVWAICLTLSALALHAGLDMDMVGEGYLTTLKKSVQEGRITAAGNRPGLPSYAGSKIQTGIIFRSL